MPLEVMSKLPSELGAAARDSDEMVGLELAAMVPKPDRPYSPKVVKALAETLASVLQAIGIEGVEVEEYTGPVAQLEPDDVRFLAMVAAMAQDYGKPIPVELTDIRGDKELTVITAHLKGLANDPRFKAFLEVDQEAAEPLAEEMAMERNGEVEVEGMLEEGEEEEGDDEEEVVQVKKRASPDALFRSRMR
jgi:hypothetical protein